MPTLRDKLKSYGTKPDRPVVQNLTRKTPECFRSSEETPRPHYGLPDVLPGDILYLLTGQRFDDVPLERLLFLDTETTGLSRGVGTIAFLVGIGYFQDDSFIVEQLLMRDYDEELPLLQTLNQRLAAASVLVTFNGKTFDLPLLQNRFLMNGIRTRETEKAHVDLLHAARSVWKLRLKRCNLAALEQAVFGWERQDDLPGSEVPKAYFRYLQNGMFGELEPILQHNAQDIRSLPLLLSELIRIYSAPLSASHLHDIYSVGRVLEKRGQYRLAHKCYRAADAGSLSRLSRLSLADSLKRLRQYEQAAAVYQQMIADGQCDLLPYVELAKIYEHRLREPQTALTLTRKALLLADPRDENTMEALQKRLLRLFQKTGGK
ncbi:MAG: ribonuclease H-like domain-containing protein [Clostridia bacterium]|nr:ribonuclease H-like domain-containing protein [Clostridia bacterium]